jgi:anti-sigma regulatory factor (Ser/Thr protein kinase)
MGALSEPPHRRQVIRVAEDVGELRRGVARAARGVTDVRSGEAELAATELGTNIVRHSAAGGYLLYRPLANALELIAVDRGPGMRRGGARPEPAAPPPRGAGLGVGLAGVARLASTFDLHSAVGEGTIVMARLGSPPRLGSAPFRWGAVNVPLGGDGESGDGWAVAQNGRLAALLVDGLGHGPLAHEGSDAAVAQLGARPPADLGEFARRAHEAMRRTRGGVLGVGVIDLAEEQLTYLGVGNISGQVLYGGTTARLLSREGTLGSAVQMPSLRPARYQWGPGATLVLASDGLHRHWDLLSSPELLEHDPAVIAAAVHRDQDRNTDDATVLVVQDERKAVG